MTGVLGLRFLGGVSLSRVGVWGFGFAILLSALLIFVLLIVVWLVCLFSLRGGRL